MPLDIQNQSSTLQVTLAEFSNITKEILNRVEFQQRLLQYQIVWGGVIVSGIVGLLRLGVKVDSSLFISLLLFTPIPPLILLLSSLKQDTMIIVLARYKHLVIRPKIQKLLGRKALMNYENFITKDRKRSVSLLPLFGEEYLLPLGFAFFLLISIPIKPFSVTNPVQLMLISLDIVLLVVGSISTIKIAYDYNTLTEVDPPSIIQRLNRVGNWVKNWIFRFFEIG